MNRPLTPVLVQAIGVHRATNRCRPCRPCRANECSCVVELPNRFWRDCPQLTTICSKESSTEFPAKIRQSTIFPFETFIWCRLGICFRRLEPVLPTRIGNPSRDLSDLPFKATRQIRGSGTIRESVMKRVDQPATILARGRACY